MIWTSSQNHLLRWSIYLIFLTLIKTTTSQHEKLRNCGTKDHCQAKPSKNASVHDFSKIEIYRENPCSCDDRCIEYGDCCEDRLNELDHDYKYKGIKNNWTCKNISSKEFVFMVTECKRNSVLATLCSRKGVTDYHYMLDVPVYSKKTGIMYGNIYCSICHNDFKNLEGANMTIMCTDESITIEDINNRGEYWPGMNMWTIGNETCKIQTEWNMKIKRRKCVPSVSECPKTWDNWLVSSKCRGYKQLVQDQDGKIYKNSYCAVCNGVDPASIRCWHRLDYRVWPHIHPNPSLSMIMNFNWDFSSCELPEVWDGLLSLCRDISCHHQNQRCPMSNILYDNLIASQIEGYLTMTCLMISIICLSMHNIIYYSLPKQQNLPAQILKSLSWSLLLAQVVFLVGVTPVIEISHIVCQGIAIMVHFFFLASFFWMNTMSLDIWRTFSSSYLSHSAARSYFNYSIYAWGVPLVLVMISVVSDLTSAIPEEYSPQYANLQGVCWFASRFGLVIFFYIPIWSLLLVNTVLFIHTLSCFQKQSYRAELGTASGRKEYTRFSLYLKLWTIMGLSWGFGMVASLANIPDFWYPFIILNGLQGAFIFIMFDLKQNIMEMVIDKFKIDLPQFKKGVSTQITKLSSSSLFSKDTGTKI
ncbi:uncharacterized protein LOC106668390 [Cimex lectularius]|uniref:G-protein coupled receptors family 2 profile 2 domain-containing protein n=1 Tax=Cimex lectularius TaxID=79782 RepID=A0A8I6SF63_CIMLE|nr:uncharacterized protein LOC106668390 [Cimex lectularius]